MEAILLDRVIVDLQAQITSLQEENDALLEELSELGNKESEEEEIITSAGNFSAFGTLFARRTAKADSTE